MNKSGFVSTVAIGSVIVFFILNSLGLPTTSERLASIVRVPECGVQITVRPGSIEVGGEHPYRVPVGTRYIRITDGWGNPCGRTIDTLAGHNSPENGG